MLVETIKQRMKQAMLEKDKVTRDILRVAVGELQTAEARGGELGDDQAEKIIRKLVKSNQETLTMIGDDAAKAEQAIQLRRELDVLENVLPRTLSLSDVEAALAPVSEQIRAAAGDGPATGVAMKFLKGEGSTVDGRTVSEAVRNIRG
jgi:uncharacterized protein YqeY